MDGMRNLLTGVDVKHLMLRIAEKLSHDCHHLLSTASKYYAAIFDLTKAEITF